MRRRPFDLVEDASQMRHDDQAQLDRCTGSSAPDLVKSFDHTVQGIVLAKEEDVVLAVEIVIQIRRRKIRRGCNVAHAGLCESAHTELPSCSAQNLKSLLKIASSEAAIAPTLDLNVWQIHSSALERWEGCKIHLPL